MKKNQKRTLPSIERKWERAEITLTKEEKTALLAARQKLGISMNEIIRRAVVLFLCHRTPEIAIRGGWIEKAGDTVRTNIIGLYGTE